MKERFFPEDYRAFYHGQISLCVDRFGGIESLRYIDIFRKNGKNYPERNPWKIFSRNGKQLNRPCISPALRFLSEDQNGALRTLYPEYPEIFASAVRSRDYNLYCANNGFSLKLSNASQLNRFIIAIAKAHYYDQTGLERSNYNQLAHEHIFLAPEYQLSDFPCHLPFEDGKVEFEKCAPTFDQASNTLQFTIHVKAPFFEKQLTLLCSASVGLEFAMDDNQWILKTLQEHKDIIFAFSLEESYDAAFSALQILLTQHDILLAKHCNNRQFKNYPQIEIDNYPEIEDFLKAFPNFQNALILGETENNVCIRASADKYGFFPVWDHIYPIRDFLICGQAEIARKALLYVAEYPHTEYNPYMFIHIGIALNEYTAFTGETQTALKILPYLKKIYSFAQNLIDEKTGLIRYGWDMAVDIMKELGLDGLFYASCINSWFYNCCIGLGNLASELGEKEFGDKLLNNGKKIANNYEKVFFDDQTGFLHAAVDKNYKRMKKPIFIHTKTIGCDYLHGLWLYRKIRQPLKNYIMNKLHHPMGATAVSFDSEAPALYLKGTRMNHHLGHACKLLRQAGCSDGVAHMLKNYLYFFNKYYNAIETFNYNYCPGNQTQTADWQSFTATATMQAIIQGAAGLAWHRGGLFYIPCANSENFSIRNFCFAGKTYHITSMGQGRFIEYVTINGKKFMGTCQVDSAWIDQATEINLIIMRTEIKPETPVLHWALDMPIRNCRLNNNSLSFFVCETKLCQIEVFSPEKPIVKINEKTIEPDYDPKSGLLYIEEFITYDSLISVELESRGK